MEQDRSRACEGARQERRPSRSRMQARSRIRAGIGVEQEQGRSRPGAATFQDQYLFLLNQGMARRGPGGGAGTVLF